MKTAAKTSMTALATILGLVYMGVSGACAQEAAAPGPSAAQVSSSVKEALNTVSVAGASASVHKDTSDAKADDGGKAGPGIEVDAVGDDKVPSYVKKVVKRLNETTENVTLENLPAAREAVVKLDVLIDIEKRLNDLSKLRRARDEDAGMSSSVSMPALSAPPSVAPSAVPVVPSMDSSSLNVASSSMNSNMGSSSFGGDSNVILISGASGSYTAQIKDGGETKMVRVGDKLSDGSKVTAISINGVTIMRPNKSKKVLTVQGAPARFITH